MIRNRLAVLLLVPAAVSAGCSSSAKPPETVPTFPVTGVVNIDGKPTAGVKVMMFPAAEPVMNFTPAVGAPHQAITDAQGKFTITTYYANDGAPVGEYLLVVYWEGPPGGAQLADPDAPNLDPAATRINKKYGDPYKPQLPNVKVEEGKPTDIGTLDLKT